LKLHAQKHIDAVFGPLGRTVVPQAGWTIIAVALLSYRQAITPDRLLGRTGGTLLLLTGLAGFADEWLEDFAGLLLRGWGPLPVLVLGTAGTLAAAIPLLKVRHLATSASPHTTPDDKVIGSVGPDLET
jgi:hypothetical protein